MAAYPLETDGARQGWIQSSMDVQSGVAPRLLDSGAMTIGMILGCSFVHRARCTRHYNTPAIAPIAAKVRWRQW